MTLLSEKSQNKMNASLVEVRGGPLVIPGLLNTVNVIQDFSLISMG